MGCAARKLLLAQREAQQINAVSDEMHADTIVVGDRGLDSTGHYVLSSIPAAIALRPGK
jgi:nucleotide-binding universal stress UspA family protein